MVEEEAEEDGEKRRMGRRRRSMWQVDYEQTVW